MKNPYLQNLLHKTISYDVYIRCVDIDLKIHKILKKTLPPKENNVLIDQQQFKENLRCPKN